MKNAVAASLLAAAFTLVTLTVLGAPLWAAFGFAYVAYLTWRLGDRLGLHK